MTDHRRESHGGRCGEKLSIVIAHHPLLLNKLEDSSIFIELGSNDGQLSFVTAATICPFVPAYLIEVESTRSDLSRKWLRRIRQFLSNHAIEIIHQSYTSPWEFLNNFPPIRSGMFLNNFGLCISSQTSLALEIRIDENCAVGSILICFDLFFATCQHWEEEYFILSDLPRHQMSWMCRVSYEDAVVSLPIRKYTKLNPLENHSRTERNLPPTCISYNKFWEEHKLM